MKRQELANYFGPTLKACFQNSNFDCGLLSEVRVRADKPLIIKLGVEEFFLDREGGLCERPDLAYRPGKAEIQHALELMCERSMYAYEEDLKKGFIILLEIKLFTIKEN